eukprot:1687487-Prymnesium_polylepis.1
MESCGARRESFIRSGVTTPLSTTPPVPSLAVHYSQASIDITCSHLTAATPPPPAQAHACCCGCPQLHT